MLAIIKKNQNFDLLVLKNFIRLDESMNSNNDSHLICYVRTYIHRICSGLQYYCRRAFIPKSAGNSGQVFQQNEKKISICTLMKINPFMVNIKDHLNTIKIITRSELYVYQKQNCFSDESSELNYGAARRPELFSSVESNKLVVSEVVK